MRLELAIVAAVLALAPVVDAANAATPVVITKRMDASGVPKQQAISKPEQSTTDTDPHEQKEFFMAYGGNMQVSWQYKASGASSVNVTITTSRTLATGCDQTTSSISYTAGTCFIDVPAGSLMQIKLKSSAGDPVFIKNVKLNFDLVDVTAPATLTNDGD